MHKLIWAALFAVTLPQASFADDTPIGNLQLVERSFKIEQTDCFRELRSTSQTARCYVQMLQLGTGCHMYEMEPSQLPRRMVYSPGGYHASVSFHPDRCGYKIEVNNLSARSHTSLISDAVSELTDGELSFFVYTIQ